jgi:hypothetical protein
MLLAARPERLQEAFGYLWPDGVPSEFLCPPLCEMDVSHYIDPDGKEFKIAYTYQQIDTQVARQGYFRPYIPLLISRPLEGFRRGQFQTQASPPPGSMRSMHTPPAGEQPS